jgi:hypothetical protein
LKESFRPLHKYSSTQHSQSSSLFDAI